MRWPETVKLIDRIRRERPELTVDHYTSGGTKDHYLLRLYCLKKSPTGPQLLPGSLDTIYGPDGWKRYLESHPEPFCRPEDSYHTNALGREVDHRGEPVHLEPPAAPAIRAEDLLNRIVALHRSDINWMKKPEVIADLAAAWGVRTKGNGEIMDYERQEVARVSGNYHASILIARTGSGLVTYGLAIRWGEGGILLEPSVGAVPFDTETEARQAAFKDLTSWLLIGGAKDQQRQLLLRAVREKERGRGLFG